jgi:hypothetical protein
VKLLRTLALGRGATTRRALLKALGVSAAAAPFLPALESWAAPGAAPRRLLLVFAPHGVIPNLYWPTGTETGFSFPAGGILEPIAAHKQDMLFFAGLKRPTCCGGMDHERLLASLYSGSALVQPGRNGNAITIDQMIAKRLPKETAFESLQYAVQNTYWGTDAFSRVGASDANMIYSGPRERIPAEYDPYKVYAKLFGNPVVTAGEPGADFERVRARKKSVLDFVDAELQDLKTRVLGADDRRKVDAHTESLREIERRLQAPVNSCGAIPTPAGDIDLTKNDNHPMLIDIMNRLTVATFACDRTRVASLQYSRAFSHQKHRWLNINEGHHDISHKSGDRRIATIQTWYHARFNDLLNGLAAVQEQGARMLDNMLVVNALEMNTPWNHNCEPQPTWTAGRLGGVIPKTGRLIDYKGEYDHQQFLVTVCHAFGLTDVTKVGDLGKAGKLPHVLEA